MGLLSPYRVYVSFNHQSRSGVVARECTKPNTQITLYISPFQQVKTLHFSFASYLMSSVSRRPMRAASVQRQRISESSIHQDKSFEIKKVEKKRKRLKRLKSSSRYTPT